MAGGFRFINDSAVSDLRQDLSSIAAIAYLVEMTLPGQQLNAFWALA
jgi:hypothetical protein